MTQLLSLPQVTADPDNSLPTDGPAGPGRVLIGDVAAAAVTLQNAVDNGSTAHRGSTDDTIELTGASRTEEVLSVAQSGAGSGVPIATFSGDNAAAHVEVTGPSGDGTLSIYGNQVLTSDTRLALGADGVASVGIEDGQLRPSAGTDAAPGVASDADPTTGAVLEVDNIGLVVGGGRALNVTGVGLEPGGPGVDIGTATNPFFVTYSQHFRGTETGTAAAPTFSMGVLDPSGMYPVSSGILGLSTAGVSRVHVGSDYIRPATDAASNSGTDTFRWNESWALTTKTRGSASSKGGEESCTTSEVATTDVTPEKIFTLNTSEDRAYWVEVNAVAVNLGDVSSCAIFKSMVRVANKAGVVNAGTPVAVASEAAASLAAATVTFVPNGGSLDILVTGVDATNLNWAATIRWQSRGIE